MARNSNSSSDAEWHGIKPTERIKKLSTLGVEVSKNVPIHRYYRSGQEMVRLAVLYHEEGSLENAYTLYMKYMTLFLETIMSHPEYNTCPPNLKKSTKEKLREVLPITEKLRATILERYEAEYAAFHANQEAERAAQATREKQKKAQAKDKPNALIAPIAGPTGTVNVMPTNVEAELPIMPLSRLDHTHLDQVVYPNDFPSTTNRTNLPTGLLLPGATKVLPRPTFDRTLKPSEMYGNRIHQIVMPGDTVSRFLSEASINTANDVETCGILAGYKDKGKPQFIMTHIIIPKQMGSANTCEVTDPVDTLNFFQDMQDRYGEDTHTTLGWIHTHPSQAAFLSSIDLHTQFSYQYLMHESLAIVCAPKSSPPFKYFSLTTRGLDVIRQCETRGFHEHPPGSPLFADADHVIIDNTAKIEIADYRK